MKLAQALVPAAVLVASSTPAHAQAKADPDPWFGPDKALHFSVSAAITGGSYGITSAFTDNLAARIAFGVGAGLLAGTGKELLDLAGLGTPSWKDFTWDVLGIAVGLGFAVTIDYAARGPSLVGAGARAAR